jgi:hypothetical protein
MACERPAGSRYSDPRRSSSRSAAGTWGARAFFDQALAVRKALIHQEAAKADTAVGRES